MSTQLPRDTLELLPQLAEASLCEEFHQDQADGKVEEWTAIINEIVPGSGVNRPRADSAQPSQSQYHTRARSSKDLGTELTDLQSKYNKVVEDVKTLRDQNKELKEKLGEECRQVEELETRMAKLEVTMGTGVNDVVARQSENRRSPWRTTQVQEESVSRNTMSKFLSRRKS
jgi:chromosome segregation ATPase